MEDIFKQKLFNLRNPANPTTFSEALFGDCYWATKKTMDDKPVSFVISKMKDLSYSEFYLKPAQVDIILKNKNPHKVKALFVTEKFRKWEEASLELKSDFINELILAFPVKTAELFERMIYAMKFMSEEVIIIPLEDTNGINCSSDIFKIAEFFRPEVIITLGSSATSGILKSSDRLSVIHGQFFSRKYTDQSTFQVIPLFHPSIIETNQNMKKTVWSDMQKIMKYLKKLP
jgi:uracil-DNA glycosylase family 4